MLDFGETYEEELPRVYGYVAYQVPSHEEAEDLTQQTFERALAHWGEFDDRRATITTWLLAIARNLVVDHYRARSRRPPTVPIDELSEGQLDATGHSDPELGVGPELESALSVLGERDREVIAQALLARGIPSIAAFRENTEAGALISYGFDLVGLFRDIAGHVHQIARGAKPSDLPIEESLRFHMAVNLKTAASLGVALSDVFVARANEVRE